MRLYHLDQSTKVSTRLFKTFLTWPRGYLKCPFLICFPIKFVFVLTTYFVYPAVGDIQFPELVGVTNNIRSQGTWTRGGSSTSASAHTARPDLNWVVAKGLWEEEIYWGIPPDLVAKGAMLLTIWIDDCISLLRANLDKSMFTLDPTNLLLIHEIHLL